MDIPALFALAFGLGLLHALDADHIAAVSGMASHRPGLRGSVRFCLRWALGHGSVLMAIGGAVLLLGMAIPERLSAVAEYLVGGVLVLIGAMIFYDLYRRRAHIHFHSHNDLPRHAHWHVHSGHSRHDKTAHRHGHAATLVGALHGLAGSAPLLLLLPLGQMDSPLQGIVYLIFFCVGVVAAMLLFGGVLGLVLARFTGAGGRFVNYLRGAVGVGTIGYGGYLLISTI